MTLEMFFIIVNLFVIEAVLSIDNAAVLAVMVKDLPEHQRGKALRYGLIGAYVFRGLCLLLVSVLMKLVWLKILGGLYLLYLVYGHFTKANDTVEEEVKDVNESRIFRFFKSVGIGTFWATVILVEIMDLAFSIDNVFAAVALSDNFWVIMAGVMVGILAMRFVAQKFVKIMKKYPALETSAFIVIGLLGLKLILGGVVDYIPSLVAVKHLLEHHMFDLVFSAAMMVIFFIPLLTGKGKKKEKDRTVFNA